MKNDPIGIDRALAKSGFVPILENCLELVSEGVTTTKEVARAISRTDY